MKKLLLLLNYLKNTLVEYDKESRFFEILNNNKNLVLIRYENNIIFRDKYEEIKTIKVPHGDVVDTTAAGDSFNGAFLALSFDLRKPVAFHLLALLPQWHGLPCQNNHYKKNYDS